MKYTTLLLLLCCTACSAQEMVYPMPTANVQLPEDGNRKFTTIFLPDNWKSRRDCQAIVAWFEQVPTLKALKTATKFAIYTESDPLYKERYARTVKRLPCICINDSTGRMIYIARQDQIPKSPTTLVNDMRSATAAYKRESVILVSNPPSPERRRARRPRCPHNNPNCPVHQEPEPAPDEPDDAVVTVDPLDPLEEPLGQPQQPVVLPLWLGLLLGVAVIAFVTAQAIAERRKNLKPRQGT